MKIINVTRLAAFLTLCGAMISFHDVMTIFDSTPTSVQVISANIAEAKKTFDKNKDLLKLYAEDYGVQKYTIHWRCDSADITYREGYPVEIVYVR